MSLRFLLLPALLLLTACESIELSRDYDRSRDFASYRSWSWKQPILLYTPNDPRIKSDLTEQRIREATDQQLEQRGLRPAPAGSQGDLQVQAALIVEQQQDLVSTSYGNYWGGYWGRGGYWGGPMVTETRNVTYKIATLQIDLYDSKDGKLVWRGSGEQVMRSAPPSPQERETAIRETVSKVLSQYPPH
ncbi:DUF4136 domain-containing protein [Zestomonas carbonaria]|uniref:DUF4136 domain-containing protein n=1 Tax=Zestomonas carbonaria TaxID=2762745 RepID=A0A7U7I9D4_9GAMM|nr:DUF4136 domain-containing protein [Pseudomonas carbonaria]CAD5107646.1 hypothetical protein PSEWESI4_01919 [Pseudomonas carbonaria]